ncbi:Ribosomal RNA large subunit methyltransferase I [Fundidesulfovibrio magnetotacticus]|uniref:Ribosomal RNA large subunit methyltransferase I n=1 Tax=Fundidesulfovibrio magnetotacticus TaxID=2730080 RepID=A0A6V8LTK6_9BACT|nr:class I SAM-dependent rRNA methyltransferase [Fundidesulfovibrio magnetotacticus]GFK95064.1 Ribosomal RNA large subunit methyltransferase I [Fundidesulfovibrio magnetotacticus]
MDLPILHLKKHEERRLLSGHLWVFSNEADTALSPLNSFQPGDHALVMSARGKPMGVAYVNPASLILARLCDRDPKAVLGRDWLRARLTEALALRERFFDQPYYRLCHGEGDHLPGLVVDRYGATLCVQLLTAGMERLRQEVLDVLDELVRPDAVLLKGDVSARSVEGLPRVNETVLGVAPDTVEVPEGEGVYRASLEAGQKTGWFYDQRPNRLGLLPLCREASVLDVFSYVGALGVGAALAGASEAVCVDSSQAAVDRVLENARVNGVEPRVSALKGDAAEVMESLIQEGRRFDVVSLDPPALVKRKKDLEGAIGGYHKLNKLASRLVAPGGFLLTASCSQHMEAWQFTRVTGQAVSGRRKAQLVRRGGQGPDHPVHPAMPETDYLKSLLYRLTASQFREKD